MVLFEYIYGSVFLLRIECRAEQFPEWCLTRRTGCGTLNTAGSKHHRGFARASHRLCDARRCMIRADSSRSQAATFSSRSIPYSSQNSGTPLERVVPAQGTDHRPRGDVYFHEWPLSAKFVFSEL